MKRVIFYLFIFCMVAIGCKNKKADPNKEYEYHLSPYATQADVDKLIKDLAALDVLAQFPLLQRDETGKIQFIRIYLYSNKSWHKSFCESYASFNDIKILKSKHNLQCSVK